MRQIILVVLAVAVAVSAVVLAFTFNQANEERLALTADLQYRTRLLADSLTEAVEPTYVGKSGAALRALINKFADREHLVGLAVYDSRGNAAATSTGFSQRILENTPIIGTVLDGDKPTGVFTESDNERLYIFVEPLRESGRVVGAFLVAQSAGYIDASVRDIWKNNLVRLVAQLLLFALAIAFLVRFVFLRAVRRLAETVKAARMTKGECEREPVSERGFFKPLAVEISKMTQSLLAARSVASEEARLRLEKLDTPWTAERLKEFIKAYLKDRPIFLVSNREPYVHERVKDEVRYSVPASGMVTALGSVMEACSGLWVASGSGSADRETADTEGKLAVPPDDPRYTLKRVWLTESDIKHYYTGFSNEALWPLCHMAHTRPLFRKDDWLAYRRVNGKFAQALLAEMKGKDQPLVLVQDFHFALLPAFIKKSRPDAQVALFWHIPFPSAEQFSICPYRTEILEGMFGADLIGFHTQQYCNNFLETVGKEVESLIDFERFAITRDEHRTFVKPFPISIAFSGDGGADAEKPPSRAVLERLGIRTTWLGLGVDRLDYTKGIMERFKGIEFFLQANPEYLRQVSFLQIAEPSREGSAVYRAYGEAVTKEAERINKKFGKGDWQPIILEKRHYSHKELAPLYRLTNFCLVSSLHDGMNLVSKEFVAARSDEQGVLILSQFTGAARDLKGALIVNPYSAEEVAEAIRAALAMPLSEQHRRMTTMRNTVQDYNVYRWSAELIKAVAGLG